MAYMIQPLTQADQAGALRDRTSSRLALASDRAATPVDDVSPPVDDSGQGLILFVVFVAAVLLITGAVAFLALFTAWWVLGLVFVLDVLVTSVVGTAVFTVLGDRKLHHKSDHGRPEAVRDLEASAQSPARSGQASPLAA